MEGSENVGEANSTEWRSQLQSEARQRVVNKIMVTLRKHLPISGNEGLGELRNIAARFEENIYNDATSQSDYLRKISMKMLTLEQKTHGGGVNGNSLSSTSGAVNQSSDPEFFEIPSSAQSQRSPPKQGEAPSVGVASREAQQKRSPPRTTSELPGRKRACNFHPGSTFQGSGPSKPSYRTTEETQFPAGYSSYHPVHHGSKAPYIPDTEASLAALKKISTYGLNKLVAEVGQNLANLDHLYKGGLLPLSDIRDHQRVMEDLTTTRSKLKTAEQKLTESASANTFLHGVNSKLSKDFEAKQSCVSELETKLRELREEHTTQVVLEKTQAEAKATLNKSLLESFEITLGEYKSLVLSLEAERDDPLSRPSVADIMAMYNEQSIQMDVLKLQLKESEHFVDELKVKLAQNEFKFGPIIYPEEDRVDAVADDEDIETLNLDEDPPNTK